MKTYLGLLVTVCFAASTFGATLITTRSNDEPVKFAAAEIERALQSHEAKGVKEIVLEVGGPGAAQSYRFSRPDAGTLVITGGDACGAMYGGLDVAEAIRFGTLGRLPLIEHQPHVAKRGIKFNIPLDLRTPSYSDNGDSFQANIPEMWSMEFWRSFLDEMARNRFNVLSLWSLHPFPSIVKVPEFPDIALNDVLRARKKFDASFSLTGSDMFRPEYLENAEVVRKMSIDEKIAFWREVMEYARDRGVEVYWFTWNMFLYGTMGKYGITHDGNNKTTADYFRASVRETVLTYPLLAGMGITAGEHMPPNRDGFNAEKWLWSTHGEGIRDALKEQPQRQFRLIHRYHMAGQEAILREFKDYPGTFEFSYKYSVAHMHSIPNPPFIHQTLEKMPVGMKTWLTVRNDDNYMFRWADPDYARDYVNNLPEADRLAGFYMGPDGYCWGREAIELEPETPRQLVMQKQWMSFMLWGRLSFDPTLPNSHFERAMAERFPEVPASKLFDAWAAASRVLPLITRFYWGDIDLKWYPEACVRMGGFHTVRQFAESYYTPMPGSGVVGIKAWRELVQKNEPIRGITPLDIAGSLENEAGRASLLAGQLRVLHGTNKTLRLTLNDIEAFAHLGHYYATKIRGAADLARFDVDGQSTRREAAVQHLTTALEHWKRYAGLATRQYKPQLLNRVGYVDLNQLTEEVAKDIAIARDWKQGSISQGTKNKP